MRSLMQEWSEILAKRQGWVCYYCLKRIAKYPSGKRARAKLITEGYRQATVDHVFPKSLGGKTELENLVLACAQCNAKKGSQKPADYLKGLQGSKTNKSARKSARS